MEVLSEVFIWIVGGIAEIIGGAVAEDLGDKTKNSVKGVIIGVMGGILIWAVIAALGFATYYLFAQDLTIAGFAVGLAAFFLVVLFVAVVVTLIKRKGKNRNV